MDNGKILAALKSLAAIYEQAATAIPGLQAFEDERSFKEALRNARGATVIDGMELRRLRTELLSLGFDPPGHWLTTNPVLAVDFREDNEGNHAVGVCVDDRKALTGVLREIRAAVMRLENLPAETDDGEATESHFGKNEVSVLRSLFAAASLMTNADIEKQAREAKQPVSERVIAEIVTDLIKRGLAERPKGPKSGTCLTSSGRKIAERLFRR